MPDFIVYDPLTKRIINKYISVDPAIVKGITNCVEVNRDTYFSLNEYSIYDNGVRLMNQSEMDAYNLEKQQAATNAENLRLSAIDDSIANVKLTDLNLTKVDAKIDLIVSWATLRTFLKLLVRYLVKKDRGNV